MSLLIIDGYKLKDFIISGANSLNKNKDYINSLNVFPVPDGDTGTNMSMTVSAAAKEIYKINSPNIYEVSKLIATIALKEARGNSGVILSQLFRGFSKALEGKERADAKDIANALKVATETAYKAVMKPKEGTILTISKAMSDKALEVSRNTLDIKEMMEEAIKHSNYVLEKTIDMLPELKQAGVVDAGGKGLLTIIEGGFLNQEKDIYDYNELGKTIRLPNETLCENIKFGYCTEFFINIKNNSDNLENNLKEYLKGIGDSIVVVSDESFIKVHIHTDNPGQVLERALKIGELDKIKIENMRIQHTNLIDFSVNKKEENEKEFDFIVVSNGKGLTKIFNDFGIKQIINGGQTMNPSTQDFLNAIENTNSKNIFILPNNKNIILSAKQAAQICETKNIFVLNTNSIPQAYSAIMTFDENNTLEENIKNMNKAIESTVIGQVTFAVRDTIIDNFKISRGDYLSIVDGNIICVEKSLEKSTKNMITSMINTFEEPNILTIYYGKEVTEKESRNILSFVEQNFKDLEVELVKGEQDLYYYIISIE